MLVIAKHRHAASDVLYIFTKYHTSHVRAQSFCQQLRISWIVLIHGYNVTHLDGLEAFGCLGAL